MLIFQYNLPDELILQFLSLVSRSGSPLAVYVSVKCYSGLRLLCFSNVYLMFHKACFRPIDFASVNYKFS